MRKTKKQPAVVDDRKPTKVVADDPRLLGIDVMLQMDNGMILSVTDPCTIHCGKGLNCWPNYSRTLFTEAEQQRWNAKMKEVKSKVIRAYLTGQIKITYQASTWERNSRITDNVDGPLGTIAFHIFNDWQRNLGSYSPSMRTADGADVTAFWTAWIKERIEARAKFERAKEEIPDDVEMLVRKYRTADRAWEQQDEKAWARLHEYGF